MIYITFEQREPIASGSTVLWENPLIKKCPDCNFADSDADAIQTHRINHHPQSPRQVFVDDPSLAYKQAKLGGGVVSEDDRRAAILEAIPDERYQCPFCLTVFPHSRVTRFFLDDGKLSKMVVCKKEAGGCGKRMQAQTMKVALGSPRDFGRFVGSYPGFWFSVDHDGWVKKLKKMLPNNNALKWDDPNQPRSLFWQGVADTNPGFAERQRIRKAERDYAEATKGAAQDDDSVDESGG